MIACVSAIALAAGFLPRGPVPEVPAVASNVLASPHAPKQTPALVSATTSLREIAQHDPERLAELSLERLRDVRDYTCTFLKQELIDGKLTPVQEIEVLFRDAPLSVFMKWVKNEDECRRALYIRGRHVFDGQEQALVEPAGVIARLFVSETLIPIHGERSRQASRRAIDEFGFKNTLEMLRRFNDVARSRGVLDVSFAGQGLIDGRPTLIIRRFLPYTGPDCGFPDARMELHFDCETLLPVAVYSWADRAGTQLLGSYVYTHVRLNPGLPDDAFRF